MVLFLDKPLVKHSRKVLKYDSTRQSQTPVTVKHRVALSDLTHPIAAASPFCSSITWDQQVMTQGTP